MIAKRFFQLVLLTAAFGVAGCKQGLGERCQADSDCDGDLICILPVGGTPASGGTCDTREGPDMSSTDMAAASADLTAID